MANRVLHSESAGVRSSGGVEGDSIRIRTAIGSDIAAFFGHQLDPEGYQMSGFTAKTPPARAAFEARWIQILADPRIVARTILLESNGSAAQIVGHVASFVRPPLAPFPEETREVTYWLGRPYWGRGIASAALRLFLREDSTRPLIGRAARDNLASIRVLEKCGFALLGYERSFAEARGQEIDEAILRLA